MDLTTVFHNFSFTYRTLVQLIRVLQRDRAQCYTSVIAAVDLLLSTWCVYTVLPEF